MPLYETRCPNGHITEDLYKTRPETITCRCGETSTIILSLNARTSGRWGDNGMGGGVNGYYDKAMGASYHTSMERDALMAKKGFVHLDDIGGDDAVDRWFDNEKNKNAKTDKYLNHYEAVMKETGDPIDAMERAQDLVA